jgi:hypothetical protein
LKNFSMALSSVDVETSKDDRAELELGLAEAANGRVQQGEAALAARDRLIVRALDTGAPVSEVAKRLGMSEQAIYLIRDRLEGSEPGARHLDSTARALEGLTDSHAFERASVALLQDLDPSLRHTGGSGDRARDGIGGLITGREDSLILMVSLDAKWSQKIRREFKRIEDNGWSPTEVWAVTNRRTTPRPRDTLIAEAKNRGWALRIFDQTWLASRLMRPDYLSLREELVGLAPPRMPAFLDTAAYERLATGRGRSWPSFVAREADVRAVEAMLETNSLVVLTGQGGVGKTRLALELARDRAERWVFIDDHALLESQAINEVAGADDLVAVIDNAHRRDDLDKVIGLLERRQGDLRLILIARPGFEDKLMNAVTNTSAGPLTSSSQFALKPLSPKGIAEILRGDPLRLSYDGAVDAIIWLSEGNPQIALLAGELSKGGTPVEAMGQDEMLQSYVASLLTSVTGTSVGGDKRVIREVLAIVAALGVLATDDDGLLKGIAKLVELRPRAFLHLLADLADAGLLEETRGQYVVRPDLLAEHVLWAAFFSTRWHATLEYQEIWRVAAPRHLLRLVQVLGRLPVGAMTQESPALRTTREELIAQAETASEQTIGTVLTLARELARGVPSLAVDIIDIALGRLPQAGEQRDRALATASEAIERVGDLMSGWPRQLRIAAAAFQEPVNEKTIAAVTKPLTSVYQRVPVDRSERDGVLLAGVQRALATLTTDYWKAHAQEPGVAQAVAIASRTLLTLTFESNFTTAENPRSLVMRSHALPGSSHTDAVLTAGAELFCATLLELPVDLQVKQLEGLAQLRRVAKGLPGAYNIQPSEETCKLALKTLSDIERWLADRLSELPLPVRAEALSVLHGDSNAAVADVTLSEYIMVAHPRPLRRRGQTWQESQEYRIADADVALQRLRSAESSTDHLDQWATWIEEGQRAIGRRTSSPVIGMALERAAMSDAGQAAGWIRHLIDTESTLLETVMPALAVIFRDPDKGQSLAEEWASHGSARIRALTASALTGSSNERSLLERLAGDDDPLVRQGVLSGIRYSPLLEGWRIDIALCAAQDNDMAAVELVLTLAERAADESGTALALSSTQVDRMCEIVLATAADERIESTYELSRIISQLTDRPRLAFEWATARVTFLARRDEEVRDVESFDTILSMHLDPLPPEILDLLPNTTDEADLSTALDRLGETSSGDTFSFNALTDIVASLDHGHHLVTDRIAEWINRNAEGDEYRASKLLESRLPWEAFTDRARILFNRVKNPRLVATLISVRDPNSWAGSVIPLYEALQEQYSEWSQDEDDKLASAGRHAVARLQRMIDAEREREAVEDDDWKWLRPAARVS